MQFVQDIGCFDQEKKIIQDVIQIDYYCQYGVDVDRIIYEVFVI